MENKAVTVLKKRGPVTREHLAITIGQWGDVDPYPVIAEALKNKWVKVTKGPSTPDNYNGRLDKFSLADDKLYSKPTKFNSV